MTTAPTVDKADTEDRETCRICEREIVEATADSEGQEALFCEGACKAWFHRKCLFMPTDHFEQMTNSIDPYVCLLCTTKNQGETIAALQQSVCALTKEVCVLKAAMASMQQGPGISVSATGKVAGTTWSTVVSRPKRPLHRVQSERPRAQSTQLSRPTQVPVPVQAPGGEGAPSSQRRDYVQVTDARKIWGTLQSTTPTAIANTIKTLAGLSELRKRNLVVKRKYKTAGSDSKKVTKWWFVVRGDENLLEQLTTRWNAIEVQTAWKLEPVLCYKNNAKPLFNDVDQTMASAAPLSIPTPPDEDGASPEHGALEEGAVEELAQSVREGLTSVSVQGPTSDDVNPRSTATETSSTSTSSTPFLGMN